MKCQNCGKNEATFYYKSNINGRVMESHLCPQCARQLGLVQDMRRPMMSSFWDDDDFFTRPFRMLEPLLGGFLEVLGFHGVAQLRLQGVALALAAELLPLIALDLVVLRGLLRRGAGLLGHVHGFRELRGSRQAPGPAAVPAPGVSVTPINRKEV